ncbi:MAG: hypothetical protein ACR2LK_00430 [Solirubrobacteraceae bacterium]
MGSRRRRRERDPHVPPSAQDTPAPAAPAEPAPDSQLAPDALPDRYARGRAKDEAIRQQLAPLEPGERPRPVTVAAILAFLLAAANLVATFTVEGLSSDQGDPTTFALAWTGLLVIAGAGMLARRYWAVLGFECILGLQIIIFTLALTRVQKWWLGVGMAIAIGLMGWLFWKLIRPMARLQMPARPGSGQSTR